MELGRWSRYIVSALGKPSPRLVDVAKMCACLLACSLLPASADLVESDSDVVMELDVPSFVEESDVVVDITSDEILVRVLGAFRFHRKFWKDSSPTNPRYVV